MFSNFKSVTLGKIISIMTDLYMDLEWFFNQELYLIGLFQIFYPVLLSVYDLFVPRHYSFMNLIDFEISFDSTLT